MGSTPSPPAAPDPVKTAAAQTQSNQDTAKYQAALNNVNQVGPTGSLIYTKNPGSSQQVWHPGTQGTNSASGTAGASMMGSGIAGDASGTAGGTAGYWETVPGSGPDTYTATTTYSPEQQKLYDQSVANQTQLGDLAGQQLTKVGGILGTNFQAPDASKMQNFDLNAQISKNYKDYTTSLLDPVWNARQKQLDTKLANQGFSDPASEGYKNAAATFNTGRNTAYDQMQLDSLGQATNQAQTQYSDIANNYNTAMQTALTERNQPLNEISALMSGSQVTQPNFVSTPQTAVSPTNVIGAYDMANQANMNNYNQQVAGNSATMGGIFGLGSSAIMGGLML